MASIGIDVTKIPTIINNLRNQYDDIVKSANNVGKILDNHIGTPQKGWCDDYARTFVRWWNASSKKEATGGMLAVDKEGKLIITGDNEDKQIFSDGEDKIKFTVQLAGRLFFISICVPFNTLSGNFGKVIEQIKYGPQYVQKGGNKELLEKSQSKGR